MPADLKQIVRLNLDRQNQHMLDCLKAEKAAAVTDKESAYIQLQIKKVNNRINYAKRRTKNDVELNENQTNFVSLGKLVITKSGPCLSLL